MLFENMTSLDVKKAVNKTTIKKSLYNKGEFLAEYRKGRKNNPFKKLLTILVAENDKSSQQIISHTLEKRGHTVFCVNNGEKILNLLEKIKFNIVLMNIQIPIFDVFEVIRKIRYSKRIRLLNGNAETVVMFMKEKKHLIYVLHVSINRVITKFGQIITKEG